MATVIKDTGDAGVCCRRSPTSTSSFARRSAAGCATEIAPARRRVGGRRASSRASSTTAPRELGFLGLKYPAELGGQGGDYVHDAVWAEELAAAGALGRRRRRARRAHRDRHAARVQVRHPRPARALPAPGDRAARRSPRSGSPSPARAPTSPRSAPWPRKADGGYVVNGSKTFITNGVRADFLVCAVKTTRGAAATTGSRS